MKIRFILLSLILLGFTLLSCKTDNSKKDDVQTEEIRQWKPEDTRAIAGNRAERGLIKKTEMASPGYVLFSPYTGTTTFLMDKDGKIVHEWTGELSATLNGYLLENGHLIRMERDVDFPTFASGGQAGRIREYDWDGNLVWDFEHANERELLHHDLEVLPNGNILAIAFEAKTVEEAIAAGKDPQTIAKAGIWPDKIIEIKPTKPFGGEIVWEWHMWDHLIQDFDETKANFGSVADHPERININLKNDVDFPPFTPEEVEHLKELGVFTSNFTADNLASDISHANAVAYNPDLDQISISVKHFGEVFIIDHSTTTEEAKGSTGGKWGRGGDLLYRWGNPANYGKGTEADRKLFNQHDLKWIQADYPGGNNFLVFNNDIADPNNTMPSPLGAMMSKQSADPEVTIAEIGNYSAVFEFTLPMTSPGTYDFVENGTFGPTEMAWEYTSPDKYTFYSPIMSCAQRLKNGNTLITQGINGRVFEVTPEKEIVWEYWNPFKFDYKLPDGSPAQPGGPVTLYGLFRSTQYGKDYPAFVGKDLKPIDPQPEPFIFKMPQPPTNDSVQ